MTTLADMIAEIESDAERSDTTAIRTKILNAIRFYQPQRFWMNETRSITFNTVAGQADYTISQVGAEFYAIDGVFLEESGGNIDTLRKVDYADIEDLYGNVTNNRPYAWTYVDKAIRLYPPPDQVYEVRPTGHVKVEAPAADDEADNAWMVYAYDLIMYHARGLLEAVRWENPAQGAVFKQMADMEFTRLQGAGTDKIGTGRLVPTQF